MSSLARQTGLNDRQKGFVVAYCRNGHIGKAALEAGYAHVEDGYRLIRAPHVIAAIHHEVQRRLVAEAAPSSLQTLVDLKNDPATPPRVRADIGIQLMKMAGHVAPTTRDNAPGKQIHEMTREEMIAYIDRNQAEIDAAVNRLSELATPVSAQHSAPKPMQVDANPLSYLD